MTGTLTERLFTVSNQNLYCDFEASFRAAGGRTAITRRRWQPAPELSTICWPGAARYANALAALGVEPGDRVTVQVEKSIANVLLYLGVLKAGGVYQPLNTAYTEAEVDYFIGDAEPKLIVCDPARQQSMRKLADRHKVFAVVNLDAQGRRLAQPPWRPRWMTATTPRERGADDLAGLLYTSGTTGRSKGAMITPWQSALQCRNAGEAVAHHQRPTCCCMRCRSSMCMDSIVALNTAFLAAAEIVWFDKLDVAGLIARHAAGATLMMGVPTFYTRLLAAKDFTAEAARNMRLFISGSAPLLAETHQDISRRGPATPFSSAMA